MMSQPLSPLELESGRQGLQFFRSREASSPQQAGRDDDGRVPRRTGTWLSCYAHIITAVIGGGILSLGWAISQIGWIFGILVFFVATDGLIIYRTINIHYSSRFAAITYYCANCLSEAYRVGDPLTGKRCTTYSKVVQAYLGKRNCTLCGFLQMALCLCTSIGYTVTGSLSIVAAKRATCFYKYGNHRDAPCGADNMPWMIFFGALQLLFSQIPDFGRLYWLSYLAALMGYGYSVMLLGLSVERSIQKSHHDYGTLFGKAHVEPPTRAVFAIFEALGSIAFSFSFSIVLVEIQDTLRQPPSELQSMRKAIRWGVTTVSLFYLAVGAATYAAFGNHSPGNILTGFGFYKPYWLVTAANLLVFVHLIGGYQVFMQPLLEALEGCIKVRWRDHYVVHGGFDFRLPGLGHVRVTPFRIAFRSTVIILTTLVACLVPFFNAVTAILGSLSFFPLTVYFPVQINLTQMKTPLTSVKWWGSQALCLACFALSIMAAIGGLHSITGELQHYRLFQSRSETTNNAFI